MNVPKCPACGYEPSAEPSSALSARGFDQYCPCCGIHFGHDDDTGGDTGKQQEIYRQWRMHWILDGMRWWSTSLEAPTGWDPRAQVRSIEES